MNHPVLLLFTSRTDCNFQVFQEIEPPSRQSNDYFYYRPDSPHYDDHDRHFGDDLSTSASNRHFKYERKVDDFAIEDLGRRWRFGMPITIFIAELQKKYYCKYSECRFCWQGILADGQNLMTIISFVTG